MNAPATKKVYAKGYCPVCHRQRAVNDDGTMRAHAALKPKGATLAESKRWCKGSWRKPQPPYVYVRWLALPREVKRAAYAETWPLMPPVIRVVDGIGANDVYQPVSREFAERWNLGIIGENTLRVAQERAS